MLNEKFETSLGNAIGPTLGFVGGFGLWGSLEWLGDCFSLGVGAWRCAGCGISCRTLVLDLK